MYLLPKKQVHVFFENTMFPYRKFSGLVSERHCSRFGRLCCFWSHYRKSRKYGNAGSDSLSGERDTCASANRNQSLRNRKNDPGRSGDLHESRAKGKAAGACVAREGTVPGSGCGTKRKSGNSYPLKFYKINPLV